MPSILRNFLETMLDFVANVRRLGFPKTLPDIWNFIKGVLLEVIPNLSIIYIIMFAAAAAVFAFAGYKLFKMGLYGVGAVAFAYFARSVAPIIEPYTQGIIPEYIDFTALVMCVFALAAVIFTRVSRKFMVLLLGGFTGYLIGTKWIYPIVIGYFNTLDFLMNDIAKTILGAICAAIIGILCMLLIHHLWIFASSLGGMAVCGLLVGIAVMPGAGLNTWMYFVLGGLAAGIVSIVYQYQQEERLNDIFYTFTL